MTAEGKLPPGKDKKEESPGLSDDVLLEIMTDEQLKALAAIHAKKGQVPESIINLLQLHQAEYPKSLYLGMRRRVAAGDLAMQRNAASRL